MNSRYICPACHGGDTTVVYQLENVPVQSCILLDTKEQARQFPTGDISLCFCDACGFIFNSSFEPSLVDYGAATEESQHFSGTFGRFARDLVEEIATAFDLGGKTIIEIGCGKGDFLCELVDRTGSSGVGIDPGFLDTRIGIKDQSGLTFRREYFDPALIDTSPDLILCRHTLEHIPDVAEFMTQIGQLAQGDPNTGIVFETPDAHRVLVEGAFWDIYYEHCSYFTAETHANLFHCSGLDMYHSYLAFQDQYIIQYARPSTSPIRRLSRAELGGLKDLVRQFSLRVAATQAYWKHFVKDRYEAGKKIVIWGGGSKAVAFLTTLGLDHEITEVIDINPFRQGKYLPCTSRQISAPSALEVARPDCVIVMNSIYIDEITSALRQMGMDPEIVAVGLTEQPTRISKARVLTLIE